MYQIYKKILNTKETNHLMIKQFAASVYIIKKQKVLMIFHRKFNKWLAPGGHLDANESPPEAALREVYEETGLNIEFISQENVSINRWNAKSIPRPYLCLLEEIPAFGDQPAHQHIDFIYIAKPAGGSELPNFIEIADMRWFSLEEIEALDPDVDVFAETVDVIRSFLPSFSSIMV